MNLELSPDQKSLQEAVERLCAPYATAPAGGISFHLDGGELHDALDEGGFLEAATLDDYGPLGGMLLLETVSALPYSVAIAGTALVAPVALGRMLPGPVALMHDRAGAAVRHLPAAKSLLIVGADEVRFLDLRNVRTRPLESVFADPFGRIAPELLANAEKLEGVGPEVVRQWWCTAIAAQIGGAATAALARAVEFVKIRRQFGHPIGTYQAIQHRLSECQVLVDATRMLARRAAVTGEAHAAYLAATYAREAAARVAYDVQQFHGASGVTLENEIHFFTYRLRSLQGELGATFSAALTASRLLWPRMQAGAATQAPA